MQQMIPYGSEVACPFPQKRITHLHLSMLNLETALFRKGAGFCALYPTYFINQNRPGWPGLVTPEPLTDWHWLSLSQTNTPTDRLPLASLCQSFPAHTIIAEGTKNILHSRAFDQWEDVLSDPKSGSSPLTSTDALAADTFFLQLCTPLTLYLPASHHLGSGGEIYPGLYASHRQYVCNSSHALRNNVAGTWAAKKDLGTPTQD